MPASETKLLSVRLPEAEKRRIKTLAVSQGLTLRQAALQAFQAWELQLQAARGTRASADVQKPGQPKRAAVPRQEQRPASTKPSSAPGGGPTPNLRATSRAWLRGAAQSDWSKCPAAQSIAGKTGNVWVVRGTRAPLAQVLQSVADGYPLLEIAEVFEITLQQLIAALQFAAENAAPSGSTTETQRTRS